MAVSGLALWIHTDIVDLQDSTMKSAIIYIYNAAFIYINILAISSTP